jgi:SAM-dependent methyltransferase
VNSAQYRDWAIPSGVKLHESPLYDEIGLGYAGTRGEDPVIADAIWHALGDAENVLNVGAGAGSYEPADREVLAVEPSKVMIEQRPSNAAAVVQATAEDMPMADNSFDAVMAVISDHHWRNRSQALRELRRVARKRVVLFNADPGYANRFWLTTEYLPGFLELIPNAYRIRGAWSGELERLLGSLEVREVAIPHDCRDGFYGAYWRQPEAYLRDDVRSGISVFSRIPEPDVATAVQKLTADLVSGAWHERHRDLIQRDEFDLGYRIVVAELG